MELELVLDEVAVALFLTVLFAALKGTPVLNTEGKRAWIPIASLSLGVGLYLIWYAWSGVTEPLGYLAAVINGAIVGAGAVGIHEMRSAPDRIRNG
jgi:hypothetical protein